MSEKVMQFCTDCVEQTERLASRLARGFGGGVIAMKGDLGAGKTAFVRGFARGLGFDGEVASPTFAIVHEYVGGRLPLYHFDMYRVDGWDDLYSTGYFEYMDTPCVMAVEWSENIEGALPEDRLEVEIRRTDDENGRRVTLTCVGGMKLEDIGD